jgi:cytochrome-b5 reductase
MRYAPGFAKDIGMIAGGTGITPMLVRPLLSPSRPFFFSLSPCHTQQIIRAALKNPKDTTNLSLIYANVNPEDILLKKELDELAAAHPDRFKVYYVLNNPPANWDGGVGFVNIDMIREKLSPHAEDAKMLLCGPPPMMTAMKKSLDELKWPAPRTVSKMGDSIFLFVLPCFPFFPLLPC